jgi:hypothetical protein
MNRNELLDIVREIEIDLYSRDFRQWLKTLTDDQKKVLVSLRTEIGSYRSGLETDILKVLADKLAELDKQLKDAAAELQDEIDKTEDFVKAMEMLGKMIGLVSRAVTLAATV